MKSINEAWKKFLYHEYEKGAGGLISMANNLKSLLQEQLKYHQQLWILSTILRKRDQNSLDSFFEYMKKGKIVNLYNMIWEKQTGLISHHLEKFKNEKVEKTPYNEIINNNRVLLFRSYPKVAFFFNDFLESLNLFILQNPDPQEIKNVSEAKETFCEPLKTFATLYYKYMETEINQRTQTIRDDIFSKEASNLKNYIGPIMSEVMRLV
jgi:hypothetical protein